MDGMYDAMIHGQFYAIPTLVMDHTHSSDQPVHAMESGLSDEYSLKSLGFPTKPILARLHLQLMIESPPPRKSPKAPVPFAIHIECPRPVSTKWTFHVEKICIFHMSSMSSKLHTGCLQTSKRIAELQVQGLLPTSSPAMVRNGLDKYHEKDPTRTTWS